MTVSLLVLCLHKGALLWAVEVLQPPLGSNYLPCRAGAQQLRSPHWCYLLL